jgi:hypothetical protein
VHAGPSARPLTAAQKTFNRLLRKVETLRTRFDTVKRQLDDALVGYGAEVRPRLQRVTALHKSIALALAPFLDDNRIKRRDRPILARLIDVHLQEVLSREENVEDDLRALFSRIHGVRLEDVQDGEADAARSEMEAMFAALGLNVDLSDVRPGMSEEDFAARLAEKTADIERQARQIEARQWSEPPRSKREQKRQERVRRAEEARKRTIATIYRQLAKALHPDLEADPAVRTRKGALMQDLTAAYANNDLHTLLRLELEWIHREESDLARLTDARLRGYNDLLQEQASELEFAISELPYQPRYADLMADDPFGGGAVPNITDLARMLDQAFEHLTVLVARLQAPDAIDAVRNAIRASRTRLQQGY